MVPPLSVVSHGASVRLTRPAVWHRYQMFTEMSVSACRICRKVSASAAHDRARLKGNRMTNQNPCAYCGVKPVAPRYRETCTECTFVCEKCGMDTPLEMGVSWDEMCDPCAVAVEPRNPWHDRLLALYGDLEWALQQEIEFHDEPSSHLTEAVEFHAHQLATAGVLTAEAKQFADDIVKDAYGRLGKEWEPWN